MQFETKTNFEVDDKLKLPYVDMPHWSKKNLLETNPRTKEPLFQGYFEGTLHYGLKRNKIIEVLNIEDPYSLTRRKVIYEVDISIEKLRNFCEV